MSKLGPPRHLPLWVALSSIVCYGTAVKPYNSMAPMGRPTIIYLCMHAPGGVSFHYPLPVGAAALFPSPAGTIVGGRGRGRCEKIELIGGRLISGCWLAIVNRD